VDVWREYAAKFTLDQLFQPEQLVPPALPPVPVPMEEEIDPLSQPLQVSGNHDVVQTNLARMVREMNIVMSRTINVLEGKRVNHKRAFSPPPFTTEIHLRKPVEKKTALQVINEMVQARLTQPDVDEMDDHGVRGPGTVRSLEYELLQERGIEVLGVNVGNLRFNRTIEETIISRWSTTWLMNAKAESEQVERKRNLVETAGHEQAIRQYADFLSKDLMQKKPVGVKETLKTLLLRTRTRIMNNPQLRQRMTEEQQDLEEIIRWTEGGGS